MKKPLWEEVFAIAIAFGMLGYLVYAFLPAPAYPEIYRFIFGG